MRVAADARGMTLIEIMVALAILVMMMTAVWTSFSGTTDAIEDTEAIQDRYATVRAALNRMASEIGGAYLSFNRPQYETRHFTLFEGREDFGNDNLTFSSFAHLRMRKDANESDQSMIQYFLDRDAEDSGRMHLYRRESRRLNGDLPEDLEQYDPAYVLLEDVDSLNFEYWDPTEKDWIKEWQTTVRELQADRLPTRVKIEIGLKDDDDDVELFTTQTLIFMQEKIDLSKDGN